METRIKGTVSGSARIGGGISARSGLKGFIGKGKSEAPVYTGEYEVTPKTYEESVLPTKNKRLTDNVSVKKIPQYEVSNQSGGETLIIGDEYYGS